MSARNVSILPPCYLSVLKDSGFFSGAKDKVNKTFNSTELKRLRVVIPPMDEQKEICREIERRAKEVNDVKAAIERQIETLLAYRKSLIHECVMASVGCRRWIRGA